MTPAPASAWSWSRRISKRCGFRQKTRSSGRHRGLRADARRGWPMRSAFRRCARRAITRIAIRALPANAGCWPATPRASSIRFLARAFFSRSIPASNVRIFSTECSRSRARRARLFGRYERGLHRLMNMYLRFVTAWYRDEFIDVFTNPTQKLQLAPAVNAVLAGNIGGSFAIWWRMQVFYLVLFLQRFVPLCPRVSAEPASAQRAATGARHMTPRSAAFRRQFSRCFLLAGCADAARFSPRRTLPGAAHRSAEIHQRRAGAHRRSRRARRRGSGFPARFPERWGFPLLRLRMDATAARAEGPLARGTWQGAPSQAPEHLQAWVHLREVFAANPSATVLHSRHGGTPVHLSSHSVAEMAEGQTPQHHVQKIPRTLLARRWTF